MPSIDTRVSKNNIFPNATRSGVTGRTNPQLLEEMFGIFRDSPHAVEVLNAVEDEREQERQKSREKAV